MKRVFSHPLTALAAGFGLRLYFLLALPQNSGDTGLYEQLAANWLKHGVYGVEIGGKLLPIDVRVPGYPAYLALVYALTGRAGEAARVWVMLGQAAVDLLTCLVVASLAGLVITSCSVSANHGRAFRAALWVAALCPFTANYVAVPLTETLAFLFTALALLLMCILFLRLQGAPVSAIGERVPIRSLTILLGLTVGFGTLIRPETPLLLLVFLLVAIPFLLRQAKLRRTFQIAALSVLFCILPLLPWGVRNAVTLHEFQFLAPEYSNLPGELIPYGFMKWERTWLYRFRDVYLVSWNLNSDAIDIDQIPSYAFDSSEEKRRVTDILDDYNQDQTLTAEEDAAMGEIGRERTARHPFRTYLTVPFFRIFTMWFTPRIELLPFSGKVWPPGDAWNNDPVDMSFTIGFFLLNIAYVVLGLWGGWRLWRRCRAARLVLFAFFLYIAVRTIFLTTLETPEPRYVLECYPILLALIGVFFPLRSRGTAGKPA